MRKDRGTIPCPSDSLQGQRHKNPFLMQAQLACRIKGALPATYFLLHFFAAAKKTALLLQTRGHLPEQCQKGINYDDNNSYHHMAVRLAQGGRTPLFSHLSFAPGEVSFLDSS